MHRLGVLLFLAGCGGQLDLTALEVTTAATLQREANRLAQQQAPLATLSEIHGNGVNEAGTLSRTGYWRYRYTSPQGAFEIRISGDGKIWKQQLRTPSLSKLHHYSIDSSEAVRKLRPKHFPAKLSLIASGSQPYWFNEGKHLSARN